MRCEFPKDNSGGIMTEERRATLLIGRPVREVVRGGHDKIE